MKREKIPILLLQWDTVIRIGRRTKGLGRLLSRIVPNLGKTLSKIGIDVGADFYAMGSLVSSLLYGIMFFLLTIFIMWVQDPELVNVYAALVAGVSIWLLLFLVHMVYPSIILKKIAIKENRDLLFALREIMIDVNSGVPLFWAIKNASGGEYGYVSMDFDDITKKIESGMPERLALRSLAIRTESEYLKRALWQMVNALESGAAMGDSLAGIVHSVEEYIYRDIKNYSSNLNFLILLYMFAAAVVPSLGVTFLVLLSAFSDFGVTIGTVVSLVAASVIMQLAMIGYMSSTRPEIFGG